MVLKLYAINYIAAEAFIAWARGGKTSRKCGNRVDTKAQASGGGSRDLREADRCFSRARSRNCHQTKSTPAATRPSTLINIRADSVLTGLTGDCQRVRPPAVVPCQLSCAECLRAPCQLVQAAQIALLPTGRVRQKNGGAMRWVLFPTAAWPRR